MEIIKMEVIPNWCIDFTKTNPMKGFPSGLDDKESTCNEGDLSSIPGLVRSPGEGKGYLLQYSGLENSMDCIVHEVAKSQTWLSDFHTLTHTQYQWKVQVLIFTGKEKLILKFIIRGTLDNKSNFEKQE